MLSREEFIRISLEINLFFQRIMKEHLFFIETQLQPVAAGYIEQANILKQSFEGLLAETVSYANGCVSEDAIKSNEFVTPYTLRAETINSMLTGSSLDTGITEVELELVGNPNCNCEKWLEDIVVDINNRSLNILEEVIAFQKKAITMVLECEILIGLYPEILNHVTHEAEYYFEILKYLQDKRLPKKTLCDELNFWNDKMKEHAEFIDGMLDPTEEILKDTAEDFVDKFEKLIEECIQEAEKQIIQKSLENTKEIRDFKKNATEGLLECKIKSIIPPLLADHVIREANHYIRLLELLKKNPKF